MTDARPRVPVLLGPTAVGKTAVALELAERLDAEIVAADSRQIYRGFTIGSAAPTPAEIARAPHHLVGFVDPAAEFTVADYRDRAEAALADILARGRLPLLVAGTGLYLSTLIEGWTLTEVAGDETLRAELEALPTEELVARLRDADPITAARLHPNDRKRLVRALEVWAATGEPLSAHHHRAGTRPVPYRYVLFGLERDRIELYERIERRVEAMIAAGWLAEVRGLLARGVAENHRAMESLGYRRLAAVLRSETTLAEAVALTQRDTRRFAKRQLTWFRRLPGVNWIKMTVEMDSAEAAARIEAIWRASA